MSLQDFQAVENYLKQNYLLVRKDIMWVVLAMMGVTSLGGLYAGANAGISSWATQVVISQVRGLSAEAENVLLPEIRAKRDRAAEIVKQMEEKLGKCKVITYTGHIEASDTQGAGAAKQRQGTTDTLDISVKKHEGYVIAIAPKDAFRAAENKRLVAAWYTLQSPAEPYLKFVNLDCSLVTLERDTFVRVHARPKNENGLETIDVRLYLLYEEGAKAPVPAPLKQETK